MKTRWWCRSRWWHYDGDVSGGTAHTLAVAEARGPRWRLWCGPVHVAGRLLEVARRRPTVRIHTAAMARPIAAGGILYRSLRFMVQQILNLGIFIRVYNFVRSKSSSSYYCLVLFVWYKELLPYYWASLIWICILFGKGDVSELKPPRLVRGKKRGSDQKMW
jgi:hypothetical protein